MAYSIPLPLVYASATTAAPSSESLFSIVPAVILIILINIFFYGGLIYLFILIVKALRKYLRSGAVRKENADVFRTLGEALKSHRLKNQMTQEFVAEQLGVSRQAVSKWENGSSDPSTGNLLALAKLYGIDAAELLKEIQ